MKDGVSTKEVEERKEVKGRKLKKGERKEERKEERKAYPYSPSESLVVV